MTTLADYLLDLPYAEDDDESVEAMAAPPVRRRGTSRFELASLQRKMAEEWPADPGEREARAVPMVEEDPDVRPRPARTGVLTGMVDGIDHALHRSKHAVVVIVSAVVLTLLAYLAVNGTLLQSDDPQADPVAVTAEVSTD